MAANDYFNSHPSNQSDQNNQYLSQPTQHFSRPTYAQDPYGSQSPNITPVQSYDKLNYPHSPYQSASPLEPNTPYQEQIPLKQTGKIQTDPEGWRPPGTHYPSSPADNQTPLEPLQSSRKRRSRKKKGFFAGPIPWVVYTFSLVQLTVFVVEIIRNSQITGSPIMTRPQFNPMIGPSTYVLINMGARFVPCMRTTDGVQNSDGPVDWPCPSSTTLDPNSPMNQCTLSELCGFGGLNVDEPNQWFRFILPIFLHAGIIHIGFNMLLQLTMGREMEKIIGSVRFLLVYIASGIFGFVLGGNFAPPAIASTGASGSLFGILAIVLLDLLYSWRERESPVKDLMWIMFDIIISLVLGLLPGLDNFSHIGGFLMGLVCGICILHSPKTLRQRIGSAEPYRNIRSDTDVTMSGGVAHSPSSNIEAQKPSSLLNNAKTTSATATFVRKPVGFFKGRKPLWWVWWLIRAGALIGISIGFIVLLTNFYKYRDECGWCKYLSCLPIKNWCEIGKLNLTPTENNSTTNARRDMVMAGAAVFGVDLDDMSIF